MVDSIKHRGPDDSGIYIDNKISLGHTRLSIIAWNKEYLCSVSISELSGNSLPLWIFKSLKNFLSLYNLLNIN